MKASVVDGLFKLVGSRQRSAGVHFNKETDTTAATTDDVITKHFDFVFNPQTTSYLIQTNKQFHLIGITKEIDDNWVVQLRYPAQFGS